MDRALRTELTAEPETDCARDCTVLSEIGFPIFAVATKFAPHGRQGFFGLLGRIGDRVPLYASQHTTVEPQRQDFSTAFLTL
jgi:hypothetical protein